MSDWSPVAVVLVIAEAITGICLIGMFVLGLRERFKLRKKPETDSISEHQAPEEIHAATRSSG